jgi:hypothetical protein
MLRTPQKYPHHLAPVVPAWPRFGLLLSVILALLLAAPLAVSATPAQADPSGAAAPKQEAAPETETPQTDNAQGDNVQNTEAKPSETADPKANDPEDEDSETDVAETDLAETDDPENQDSVEMERSQEIDEDGEEETDAKDPEKKKCIIGSTATLLEKQSELKFRARIDTGAKSCSLHYEKIKIEDASEKEDIVERMTENIGKVIHFEVKNGDDKTHIISSKIAGYVIIKNSNKEKGKRRYKVPLTFRWKHMEKEVLVTLNKRNHMDYPLLLGRNFLRGDFLVDVEQASDD